MKSLKSVFLAMLGVCLGAGLLHAQPPKGEGRRGGRGAMSPEAQVARLDEALALTAEQKGKVTAIFSKVQQDIQALSPEDRRTKGAELFQAANKEVRALLTEPQKAKFDAMPQGMGRRGGGQGKKKDR